MFTVLGATSCNSSKIMSPKLATVIFSHGLPVCTVRTSVAFEETAVQVTLSPSASVDCSGRTRDLPAGIVVVAAVSVTGADNLPRFQQIRLRTAAAILR